MPITIKQNSLNIRNENGDYVAFDTIKADQQQIYQAKNAAINQVVAYANSAIARAADTDEMEGLIANQFNSSSSYKAGDYVIAASSGEDYLYRFTSDYTSGDNFDSKASKVKLASDVSNLKSAVNPIGTVWHSGYVDSSGVIQSATNRSYTDLLICPAGTVCKYVGETGNTSICSIAWYDEFGKFISGITSSSTVGDERTETAPSGCHYCRLTTRDSILGSSYVHFQSNTTSAETRNIYDDMQDIRKGDLFIYQNKATLSLSANETAVAMNPVKSGAVYKISVVGESTFGVNVRSGNGRTVVADIRTSCNGGHTYYTKYTGNDATNLIISASGSCTVTVEDLTALKGKTERITVTVTSARELLEAIEISHTIKMTIIIAAGTYDIIAALGETYFNSAPSENFGPILCNDVVLIGDEGAVLTAHYTGSNTNTMKYFSVFNAGQCVNPWNLSGSFELHNIHLSGSKIRYLIHDENNAYTGAYHNVYDGCTFWFDNRNNTEWSSQSIIGGGLGKSGFIEIMNCIFEVPTLANRAAVLSYHNSTATNAKSHLVITGNLLTPVNAALKLGYHGTTTEKTIVLASNNKWGIAPVVQAETAQDEQENFELIEWNNVIITE